MKAALSVLCVVALAAAAAAETVTVNVGEEVAFLSDSWLDHKVIYFNVAAPGVSLGTVQVRMVRRSAFDSEDSSVWLCDKTTTCVKKDEEPAFVRNMTVVAGKVWPMSVHFDGKDKGDRPTFTIEVCLDACKEKCKNDCSNHGNCVPLLHKCLCDTGRHNRGSDCNSSGWDWYNKFICIGVCCGVGIILIIVGICICCCCCCKCCCFKD